MVTGPGRPLHGPAAHGDEVQRARRPDDAADRVVVASGLVGRYIYTIVPRRAAARACPQGRRPPGRGHRRRPQRRAAACCGGARRSPPGTRSTCRSPGRSSSPRSSTWSQRSTTRRCSGEPGRVDGQEQPPELLLPSRDRRGRRARRGRGRPHRRARPVLFSPGGAQRPGQGGAPERRRQPRRARRRLRRLSPRAVELPDHGRQVPRLPRDVGARSTRKKPARGPRPACARRPAAVATPTTTGPTPRSPSLDETASRTAHRLLAEHHKKTAQGARFTCDDCHPKGYARST